ncbi:replication protein RepA [Amycolatopsis sp. cmx-4-61]|uniref:replication protein RepA n=1 Tax=Amycolatopsis sp. cmx-4-61 TaxID=2790937 RepID=UPI00397DADF5
MPAPKGRPKSNSLERAKRIADLRQRDDDNPESLAFNPAPLTMAFLPYREPKPGTEVWVRRNGAFWLTVRPGVQLGPNGEHGAYGYPFGLIPRALLMWVTAEALRTKSRQIELGTSLSDFVVKLLGQRATGGRNGTRTRVKEQATRLFNAEITYQWRGNNEQRQAGVSLKIAKTWALGLGDGTLGQQSLFPSYVQLSADFYEEIVRSPVPLNLEIVKLLGSAAEIDLYAWLTYKMFLLQRTGKSFTHSWEDIGEQFGYQFSKTPKGRYKLKENIIAALKKVIDVYPVNVEVTPAGLLLRPSLTSVPTKETRVLRGA